MKSNILTLMQEVHVYNNVMKQIYVQKKLIETISTVATLLW